MTTTAPRSRLRTERRRRRWRSLLVAVVSLALVATAGPALALRFADVTSTGTQVFPAISTQTGTSAAVAPATTATWTATGATAAGGREAWPWTGAALATQFAPSSDTGGGLPPSPIAQTFTTTCAVLALLATDCPGLGTITLSFDRAVTNPVLYVAGLGNQDSLLGLISTSRSAARLRVASALNGTSVTSVAFGDLHSVNDTGGGPTLRVQNGWLETPTTAPGSFCGASGPGSTASARAGCGRVQLTGTFTSVTFSIATRSSTYLASLVPSDTYHLYVALPDQPLPTATAASATTTRATPVEIDLRQNVTPAAHPGRSPIPIESWTILPTNGWSTSASDPSTWSSAAGSITFAEAGVATFTPAPDFIGVATARFEVTDREASTASAEVTLTVTGPTTPLTCPATVHQLGPSGEIRSVPTATIGNQANVTSAPVLPAVVGTTLANGLGVAPDGASLFYISMRSLADGTGSGAHVTRYRIADGTYTHVPVTEPNTSVAGAVNPVTGNFYYGGVAGGAVIYMFEPSTARHFAVGTVPGGGLGNGDYAFTSSGDLHILSDDTITVVRAGDLPASPSDGPLVGTPVTTTVTALQSNGLAFGSDGFLYLNNTGPEGAASSMQRIDAVTGALAGSLGGSRQTASTFPAVDLGSCAPTSSIRLEKVVDGRVVPTDQFTLNLDTADAPRLTATTAGTSTGVQAASAGPRLGQVGRTYTFSETGASGTTLTSYRPSWQCFDGDTSPITPLGTPTAATSGSYTFGATSPRNVICRFTNTTGPLLSITKSASAAIFTPDQPASYGVTVTNTGQTPTSGSISVTDVLPVGIALSDRLPLGDGWVCSGTTALTCTYGPALAAGASTTLTLAVATSTSATSGTNTATVSGGGDATCPTAGRCTATVQVAIATPALATSKSLTRVNGTPAVAPQLVLPGDVLTWTVTVVNSGTGAGMTTLSDDVPTGTTSTGTSVQGWSCPTGSAAGTACEQTVTVAAGSSATRTFTATVDTAPPTSIVNTVTSSLGTCAACTVTTAVAPLVPVVKAVETQGRPALPGGAVVPYTLTFTNAGTVAGYLDYDDVLAGVLDDAVWPTDAGGALLPPTVTPSGSVTAVFDPAAQRITVSGSVPAGQTVQVTYAVQVREWAAIVADSSDALLRNAVVRSGAAPPASCDGGSPTCLETPLASYSLVTGATPSPSEQVDPGETITTDVAVVSHPRSTGPVAGVQVVATLTEALDGADFVTGSAALTVSGVVTPLPDLAPVLDPLTQQWTLTSPAFTLPATATATLTYAVTVRPGAWFAQLRNVAGVTGGLAPETCPVVTGPQPPVSVVAPACQTVHQITGLIEIQKTGLDGDGELVDMPGSTFAVHGVLEGPTGPSLGPVSTAVVPVPDPDRTGRAVVAGIPIGTHYLVETVAPEGYSLLAEPVLIEVTADRTVVVAQDEAPTVLASNPPAPAFPLVTVRDVPRFVMPEAGGSGSAPFRALGLGLLGGAVALLGLLDLRRRAGPATPRPEGRAAAPPG